MKLNKWVKKLFKNSAGGEKGCGCRGKCFSCTVDEAVARALRNPSSKASRILRNR